MPPHSPAMSANAMAKTNTSARRLREGTLAQRLSFRGPPALIPTILSSVRFELDVMLMHMPK